MKIISAEIELPSTDLHADLAFYTDRLGFRLESIHPSDDPAVAVISGFGLTVRLDRQSAAAAGIIRVTLPLGAAAQGLQAGELVAPGGTRIILEEQLTQAVIPRTRHAFRIRQLRDAEPWVIGRAGMMYRDLIDDRLGGSIIASHIRIPEGGPVPDMVHYHTIGFQLIYCLSGWVRLVYEDQGPPFILRAGDCVTQPPKIRHRVLESSDNLEVLEIGVPAHHMTTIDHDLELPTHEYRPDRDFDGQVFCHHCLSEAEWGSCRHENFQLRDTGISVATGGLAAVNVLRFDRAVASKAVEQKSFELQGEADIHFMLVSKGSIRVQHNIGDSDGDNQDDSVKNSPINLNAGDAMVLPPGMTVLLDQYSDDVEFIQVEIN